MAKGIGYAVEGVDAIGKRGSGTYGYQGIHIGRKMEKAAEAARENSALRGYILNRARPWPSKDSLFISGDYIVLVLDEDALIRARRFLADNIR